MHNDVLWFNISVYNSLTVDIIQSLTYLLDNICSLPLMEPLLLLQHRKQMPIHAELLQQIHTLTVVEEPIQVDDIVMLEIELDLYFSHQLILHFFLLDNRLLQYLHSTHKT